MMAVFWQGCCLGFLPYLSFFFFFLTLFSPFIGSKTQPSVPTLMIQLEFTKDSYPVSERS